MISEVPKPGSETLQPGDKWDTEDGIKIIGDADCDYHRYEDCNGDNDDPPNIDEHFPRKIGPFFSEDLRWFAMAFDVKGVNRKPNSVVSGKYWEHSVRTDRCGWSRSSGKSITIDGQTLGDDQVETLVGSIREAENKAKWRAKADRIIEDAAIRRIST